MATTIVEEADLRAFARVLAKLFGVPVQDDLAALRELIINLTQQVQIMSGQVNQLDQAITGLQSEVSQDTDVTNSAVKLISGIAAQIAAAVAAAQAQGVQPAQLAQLTQLQTSLQTQRQALAAAVAASTPAQDSGGGAPADTVGGGASGTDTTGGGTGAPSGTGVPL